MLVQLDSKMSSLYDRVEIRASGDSVWYIDGD